MTELKFSFFLYFFNLFLNIYNSIRQINKSYVKKKLFRVNASSVNEKLLTIAEVNKIMEER